MKNPILQDLSVDISEDFSEQTILLLHQDLNFLRASIKKAKQELDSLAPQGSIIQKSISTDAVLKNAYRLIMISREYFTGQVITYRIYYAMTGNEKSFSDNVGVYDLTEEQILNLTKREGNALRLKASFKKALENTEKNAQRELIFEKHWQDISAGLQKAEWKVQTVYIVRKYIFEKYARQNPGLRNKKDPDVYAAFNRGNLYESFDATSQDVYGNIEKELIQIKLLPFRNKYFGKYLTHDQIKGFQSGDIGLTQLKARHAQIMETATLKIYLNDLLQLFDLAENNAPKKELYNKVKQMFTDPSVKKIDKPLDDYINTTIDNLIKVVSKK